VKKKKILLYSIIMILFVAFVRFDPAGKNDFVEVSAAETIGNHEVDIEYVSALIYDDHDDPGPGEWYFRLQDGGATTLWTSDEYSIDTISGNVLQDMPGSSRAKLYDVSGDFSFRCVATEVDMYLEPGHIPSFLLGAHNSYCTINVNILDPPPNTYINEKSGNINDVVHAYRYRIVDAPPSTPVLSGDSMVYRGQDYYYQADSTDPEGDSVTYEWWIDGAMASETGSTFGPWGFGTEPSIVGWEQTLHVRAIDVFGMASDWASMTVTVGNQAPTVDSMSGDTSGYRGTTMHVTALASDPEDDDLTYEWKIDSYVFPGQTDAEFDEYIDYNPGNVGPHTVYVRVQDEIGDYSDWASMAFTTLNHAPTVSSISGDSSGYRDVEYSWSATGSDAEDDSLTYEWYVDGTYESGGSSLSYTFDSGDALGSHEIKVRVKDVIGDYSGYSTLTFNLMEEPNNPPTVGAVSGPTSGYRDVEYSWSATGSDPDGDSIIYYWYVDGTYESGGSSLSYTFDSGDALGSHEIKVRVKDPEDAYSSYSTLTFTLTDAPNDPPTISEITGPNSATIGDNCTFTASATDPDGDDVTITWYINGTSQTAGESFIHTFDMEAAGDYLIQARAQDSKGASSDYASHPFTLNEPSIMPFYCSFNVTFEEDVFVVETCSNSSVTDLTFNLDLKRLKFNVDGENGTSSFCNVTVPAELMSGNFSLFMDDVELVEGVDYAESYNGTHYVFAIDYEHSSHQIEVFSTVVIPDFAGWLFVSFTMSGTAVAFAFRKRLKKHRKST
jgi:hypothetical protein